MKKNITWYLLCTFPFFLFFLQFPLQGSLTGDLDTWANMSMFKQIKLFVDHNLFGFEVGQICYPANNTWKLMGADFGIGIIFVFFNFIGINDLWSNYLFISILFSLNSISLYFLLKTYINSAGIAILGSLIFNFSHFTLANLENPNTLVFFFSFFALYQYRKNITQKGKSNIRLLYAALLTAVSIYFSPYNFLFHCIIWLYLIISEEDNLFHFSTLKKYIAPAILILIAIFPYINTFIFKNGIENSYNVIAEDNLAPYLSLQLSDYFRTLPNHLYLRFEEIFDNLWLSKIKSAYLGIILLLLIFYTLFTSFSKNKKWLGLCLIGIIIATGPYLIVSNSIRVPSILYPLYEYLSFAEILRLPFRGYFISIFAMVIIACNGLILIKLKFSKFPFYLIIVFAILIENIPLKMQVYNHHNELNPEIEYIDFIKESNAYINLELPSKLFNYDNDRREYIYMYWQSFHKKNIVNGNLGFLPSSRMNIDSLTNPFNEESIKSVILNHNIDHIIYHKNLVYTSEELEQLVTLKQSVYLKNVFETDNTAIFECNKPLN